MNQMSEGRKRVLVVDDEPGIVNILRIKLKLHGYEVLITTRGIEAVELARIQNPDIMLLDIIMPDITGFEVLERVRTFSTVPVIVFTARREMAEKALKSGAAAFMAKPFNPDQIIQKIESVLNASNPQP
jgi:DNA-binding response OmpR family regulator